MNTGKPNHINPISTRQQHTHSTGQSGTNRGITDNKRNNTETQNGNIINNNKLSTWPYVSLIGGRAGGGRAGRICFQPRHRHVLSDFSGAGLALLAAGILDWHRFRALGCQRAECWTSIDPGPWMCSGSSTHRARGTGIPTSTTKTTWNTEKQTRTTRITISTRTQIHRGNSNKQEKHGSQRKHRKYLAKTTNQKKQTGIITNSTSETSKIK